MKFDYLIYLPFDNYALLKGKEMRIEQVKIILFFLCLLIISTGCAKNIKHNSVRPNLIKKSSAENQKNVEKNAETRHRSAGDLQCFAPCATCCLPHPRNGPPLLE